MNDRFEAPGGASSRAGVWLEGCRVALLLPPRWRDGGTASFWLLGALLVAIDGLAMALQRLDVAGPAVFDLAAVGTWWAPTLLAVAACALTARLRAAERPGPDGALLLGWLLVCALLITAAAGVAGAVLRRGAVPVPQEYRYLVQWGLFTLFLTWNFAAGAKALCAQVQAGAARLAVVGLLLLQVAATLLWPPQPAWRPAPAPIPTEVSLPAFAASGVTPEMREAADEEEARPVFLTQERLEAQSRAVVEALDGVRPQRPGVTELYAITFAPYADEDVFTRESAMVAGVMRDRFDAAGRVLTLQNHASTLQSAPWATPLNLERAIHRMGERMDPAEDILFLHLTSHGGKDGRLAAGFEPLWVPPVTPRQLRRWLDEAGIRYAVISVSACFSGSWIKPLAAPGTLVMTAADATHTSYGCGRRSPLTFFGRAVYDEQLRTTRSFEAAFAAALPVIDRREKEAGKRDGPSNPQILVGNLVRPRLDALVRRLEAESPSPPPAAPAVAASGTPSAALAPGR